jgi:3-phenylpropionate/trans-cinnamate dioxygenase alpha subunit
VVLHLHQKDATPEERKAILKRNILQMGPSGVVEQDDGENWELSTKGAMSPAMQDVPMNYAMGAGHGESIVEGELGFPAYLTHRTTEEYMRWTYRSWAEWMDAEDWPSLKADHSRPEQD